MGRKEEELQTLTLSPLLGGSSFGGPGALIEEWVTVLQGHILTCDPAGQAEDSKQAPDQKVKKESPGEFAREFWGVPANSQKESKTSLREILRVETHLFLFFWLRRLIFDSFWRVYRDPRRLPRRLPRDSFEDSPGDSSRPVLTSLPDRRDRKS